MRRLLLLVALLLALTAGRAQAAVAFVQSGVNTTTPFSTGTGTVTLGSNSTSGNLMVVIFAIEAASRTVTSVTAGGATLSLCSDGVTNATIEIATVRELWAYCGAATGASTSVSVVLSSAFAGTGFILAAEFSGQHATTPVEDVAVASGSAVTPATHNTGNVTTANAGSAIIGFVHGTSGTYTNDASGLFTEFTSANHGNGVAAYDLVGATTDAYEPTTSGTEETVRVALAIAPAAGGGGGSSKKRMLMGVGQ